MPVSASLSQCASSTARLNSPLSAEALNPSRLQAWWWACRPRTLPVSLSPVLVGTAVAWYEQGTVLVLPLLFAILAAALIQIGTNLFNDVADFERGADTPNRLGPRRATAEGWLSAAQVRRAAWCSFALAFLCGLYLVYHGGWPIVVIGLSSLLAGWGYTCGPWPIAYRPLGEVFVCLFFGLVAVCGSCYLQTLSWSDTAFFAAILVGVHAAAVITVNNYRDLDEDRLHGKLTLAVRCGRRLTRRIYAFEILLPFILLPLVLYFCPDLGWLAWLPLLSLPFALRLIVRFYRTAPGAAFNLLLAATARLQLLFTLLLAGALCVVG